MSQENLSVEAVINRRERRIAIKLYETAESIGSSKLPLFEPGDEINGVITLESFGGQTPITSVRLAVVCLQQIKWKSGITSDSSGNTLFPDPDNPSDTGRRKSIFDTVLDFAANALHLTHKQIHFERDIVLHSDIKKERLPDGKYDLPFRVTLPYDGLYSTMRSVHGFIRYTLEVFTTDEDGSESRAEREIVILSPMDEHYNIGIGRSIEKTLKIPDYGRVTLLATLESPEYCPGDTIRLLLNCENESSLSIRPLVTLYQTQSLCCEEHSQTWETVLNDTIDAEIVTGSSSCSQTIRIPLSANSVLSLRSPMITVSYFIHVTIDELPEMFDLSLNIPFLVISKRMLNASRPGTVSFSRHPSKKAFRQISAPIGFQDSPKVQRHHSNKSANFIS